MKPSRRRGAPAAARRGAGGPLICTQPLIIAIDGPAGSGKSTVALRLARRLGLPYLNSGAIYRAVTLAVMEAGGAFEDPAAVAAAVRSLCFGVRYDAGADARPRYFIGERDVTTRLKDPDTTAQVYRIANVPAYRQLLVDMQRRFAARDGVVAEGRDMGTVIFPQAALKIFLDAPPEERARRQHVELCARGVSSTYEDVLAKVRERDHHDTSREAAPLAAADDAVHVESGGLAIAAVEADILRHLAARCRDGARCRHAAELAAAAGAAEDA